MIYCNTNNTNGRLGNQIMRIMSMMGIAQDTRTTWAVPEWPYARKFKNHIPIGTCDKNVVVVKEKHYHHTPEYYYNCLKNKGSINLSGYFQSFKYWRDKLEFTEEFSGKCASLLGDVTRPIAISVRRGDFVNNPNYFQLPITYYILALINHFPDWKERSIVFFSDDIDYCRLHFQCLPNAVFMNGSDIEQLCAMTLCDDFIISNSTFSFCGAYLSKTKNKKVIRPAKNMDGPLAESNSEQDYWPEDWVMYDHRGTKIPLQDVTFVIPVSYDHDDRKKNLDLSVCMIQRDFETSVIVGEQGGKHFSYFSQWCKYINYEFDVFHRTRMINDMVSGCSTKFFFNWDADVIVPPMQVLYAVELMRDGYDIVYPYDGRFARVDRNKHFGSIEKALDIGVLKGMLFKGMIEHPDKGTRELIGDVDFKEKYYKLLSVGGAIGFNTESFIDGGMENEKMISYAPEDLERYIRFFRLGFKGARVNGVLYHIDHFRGENSRTIHANYKHNETEYDKIYPMSKDELLKYVRTWDWVSKYTASYYDSITESIQPAKDAVFGFLRNHNIPHNTILDIGCGIGQWHHNEYYGVDYRVKEKDLLIPKENYLDLNLEEISPSALPYDEHFDLVLCLEVAEHLSESIADTLVETLCEYGHSVLFSAAIPYQTGVGHINEQWQSYWADKFKYRGFYPFKAPIKDYLFDMDEVPIWYRNNMILFVRKVLFEVSDSKIIDFIHPKMFENLIRHWSNGTAV
jgi:SAM-dependent methyltransferase